MKGLKIVWQDEALENLDDITASIDDFHSTDHTDKLLQRINEVEGFISQMPLMYPASRQRPSARRAVVTKQISLIYAVKKQQIDIVSVYDNRRDPGNLKLS